MTREGGEASKGWSEAETQRLRALLDERRSASEIVVLLWQEGFPLRSRSAVLGRVHRLGIGVGHGAGLRRDRIERSMAERAERRAAVPRAAKVARVSAVRATAPAQPVATPVDVPAFDPDRPGVSLFLARHNACKFNLRGEGLGLIVCGGAKAPGSNWCPACRPRATAPVRSVARAR